MDTFLFWYDRDRAGKEGQEKVLEDLEGSQMITAKTFDWNMTFPSPTRGEVKIPENIGDVCEFSIEQLQWLRNRNTI